MANSFWKFFKGVVLRPETSDPSDNVEGSIFVNSTDDRIKSYIEGSVREIVTHDQIQNLENKTFNAVNNTITTAASGNLVATELNSALAELQTDIDTRSLASDLTAHINDVTDAHDASAISVSPAGDLGSTDVQSALVELQGDINTIETDYVKRDGTLTLTGDLNLNNNDIINIQSLSKGDSSITLDNGLNSLVINNNSGLGSIDIISPVGVYIESAGQITLVGPITASNNIISDITNPVNAQDAATKDYVDDHINNSTDAHDASAISVTPAGNLSSTDVQSALVELQGDIDGFSSTVNVTLTDSYMPDWTGEAGPMVKFNNGTGENAGVVVEDTAIADAAMRPLIIGTGARTNVLDTLATKFLNLFTGANKGTGNSGAIFVQSGYTVSNNTSSGKIALETGFVTGAGSASGAVELITGPAAGGGTRGNITMSANQIAMTAVKGLNIPSLTAHPTGIADGTQYYNTVDDKFYGYANGAWVDLGATGVSGANTTLSNLTSPTAVNQHLLPDDSNNSRTLGSIGKKWDSVHVVAGYIYDLVAGVKLALQYNNTTPTGITAAGIVGGQTVGDDLVVMTSNSASALATSSGDILIETGNRTAGTGQSGNIRLTTGTSSGSRSGNVHLKAGSGGGGTQGRIIVEGKTIGLDARLAANPIDTYNPSEIYYNTTDNEFKFYDGTAWRDFGNVVQVASAQTGSMSTGATALPYDDTVPQNTEGTEFLAVAITPTNTNNLLVIEVDLSVSTTVSTNVCAALFQDATASAIAATASSTVGAGSMTKVLLNHKMPAGTTSLTVFKVNAGTPGGLTVTLNGDAGVRRFGGVCASSIKIWEIKA